MNWLRSLALILVLSTLAGCTWAAGQSQSAPSQNGIEREGSGASSM
jgi:hypothetical protein